VRELAQNMMSVYGHTDLDEGLKSAKSMEAGAYANIDATFQGREIHEISELELALAVIRALVFDWGTSSLRDDHTWRLLVAPFVNGFRAYKTDLLPAQGAEPRVGCRNAS